MKDFPHFLLFLQESEHRKLQVLLLPDKNIQKIFMINPDTPIFYKTSVGIAADNSVFEYSELYFNPKIYEFSFVSKR